MTQLFIERTGLVTSLGHGVRESAAAARAGIVRPDTIDGIAGFDPEEMQVPLPCHPVRNLTDGFEQTGRWLQLALAAVGDCLRASEDGPAPDARAKTALVLVLPTIDVDRFGWPEDQVPAIVQSSLVEPLRALTDLPLPCEPEWVFQGSGGTALALAKADELTRSGKIERVLVLAVDSWLDTTSLMVLEQAERLKGPESPAGLMPGEAAACVCVSGQSGEGLPSITGFHHASTGFLPLESESDVVPTAQRLGTALGSQMAPSIDPESITQMYSDVNGEEWRSHTHGTALVKANETADMDRVTTVFPAASFGDIGAVHALASVCLFEQEVARGYGSGGAGLVLAAGEDGTVSSISLGRAPSS